MIAVFFMTSCSDDGARNARLEVRLTDAPGDYEAVNIDIVGVEVHSSEGGGWQSLDVAAGVYNLLDLTNGLDTLLGAIDLPPGELSQIRLVLGDNNSITVDGQTYDLSTPSGQQSGLKLNVHTNLVAGLTYTMVLDFDAARSIVLTGNGKYILKPVIRVITTATSGGIAGSVSNPASTPAVFAIIAPDTLGSTFADSTGHFMINGLPAGVYTVSFSPAAGYTIADRTGVIVTVGNITDLGVVTVN